MLIRGEIVKKKPFTVIISDPDVVFPCCFKCLYPEIMFSNVCSNSSNFTAKNVLLTF